MALELIKKNQNSTTENFRHRKCDLENLCWAGYLKFKSEILTTNNSRS